MADRRAFSLFKQARAASIAQWNRVAKPIGSLGLLEGAVAQIAALTGSADVALDKRAVVVMCADNGVVDEGVSQVGSEITALIASGIARGTSSVCRMARTARVDAIAVDVGMRTPATSSRSRRPPWVRLTRAKQACS